MATLEDLADRAQNAIGDAGAGTWSQAVVEEWICEGIRDYGMYFRRTVTEVLQITTENDSREVSRFCREVIHVEYPTGDDPPTYLKRKSRYAPDFYDTEDHFDFEPTDQYGHTDEVNATSPYLVFSFTLDSDETLTVLERCIFDAELESGDSITIPDEHMHLLILFVVWKAHSERAVTEAANPDSSIRMLQQMKEAARIAEADYRRALDQAQVMAGMGGWTPPWKADGHDRIY